MSAMTPGGHFQNQDSLLRIRDIVIPTVVKHQRSFCRSVAAFHHAARRFPAGLFIAGENRPDMERIPVLTEEARDTDSVAEAIPRATRIEPAILLTRGELVLIIGRNYIQMRIQKHILHLSRTCGRIESLPPVDHFHRAIKSARFQKIPHHVLRLIHCGDIRRHRTALNQTIQQLLIFAHIRSCLLGNCN